jgi:hypothetical protein
MKWLRDGIRGRSVNIGGPLSIAHITGADLESAIPAFTYLLDVLAKKHPKLVARQLSEWFLTECIRLPCDAVDFATRIGLHLSIAASASDEPLSTALVGMVESVACLGMSQQAQKVVSGFADVVLNEDRMPGIDEWLASRAGRLCLKMWERRLADAADLPNPAVRESVAHVVRKWSDSGLPASELVAAVREKLKRDCRLRVRVAASREG